MTTTQVQGILVNPFERSVSLVEVPRGDALFPAVYKLIDADTVDVVRAHDYFGGQGGAMFYVDDSGLFRSPQAFTLVNKQAIAGKFLILRNVEVDYSEEEPDEDGWLVGVDFTTDDVFERIQFISREVAEAVLERGTVAAAAAYVSHGLHVERSGTTLFVTEMKDPK